MSLSGREIAQAILDNIGGPDNVKDLKNCSTRLCFRLKNASMVREENIKRLSSIKGIIEADNLYYIIPENGFNLRIYNELAQILGIRRTDHADSKENQAKLNKKDKPGFFSRMKTAISKKERKDPKKRV